MIPPVLTTELRTNHDVVVARQRTRQVTALLGFDPLEQTQLATAVSEIARNAVQHAGGGKVTFELTPNPPMLLVRIADRGPGIRRLQDVLDTTAGPSQPMRHGLLSARRLAERFEIDTEPGRGTTVTLGMSLPALARMSSEAVGRLSRELAAAAPLDTLDEIRTQSQELMQALEEGREHQGEVERLNQELAETNRGVLALYAELDEKAADLARASELKSRFLSNISHELRTPLNAILNITGLLVDQIDGPLNAEQERQVRFVRGAAMTLTEMVNDLLDLARIEAGRSVVRPASFTVPDLFAGLRGMFRAITPSDRVALVFDEPADLPALLTDEGKLSQILRNLISNALKFTERGEVRVRAFPEGEGRIAFAVSDTGIGIAPADQERIFEEFSQLESALQRKATGSGLGLPLSRKLAELLGGQLAVSSTPGTGSTFTVTLPTEWTDRSRLSDPGLRAVPEIQHA